MSRSFVDTNYFLRFLLDDNKKQHETAKELFLKAATGKIQLFTSSIVLFEVFWVLKSFYGRKKVLLIETLRKLLAMEFIDLKERELLLEALDIYKEANIDLEDAYNLCFSIENEAQAFYTYDKKLKALHSSFDSSTYV